MDLGNNNVLDFGAGAGAAAQPASSGSVPAVDPGAVDQQTYTFIDHDDDPCTKKISNSQSRKAIRSHVMRDVRRRERLAGFKRGSKRDAEDMRPQTQVAVASRPEPLPLAAMPEPQVNFASRPEPPVYAQQPVIVPKPVEVFPVERTSASSSASPAVSNSSSSTEEIETAADGNVVTAQPTWQHTVAWATTETDPSFVFDEPSIDIGISPTVQSNGTPDLLTWIPDFEELVLNPERQMKSVNCIPAVIMELIYYWRNMFVPMTFPNGFQEMRNSGMGLMIQSVFSDVGCFFAFMSVCAAHRAIMCGRIIENSDDEETVWNITDETYELLKQKSIHELNRKMEDPAQKSTNETLETVVSLLTSSIIAGLFREVRTHLRGLKELVDLRGGYSRKNIRCVALLNAVFTADVKAASGLMTKPVFPFTWGFNPMPHRATRLCRPRANSRISQFGAAIQDNPLLSAPLQRTIHKLFQAACFSENASVHNMSFSFEDNSFFRLATCEVEHELLSYPYRNPPLHPVESVVRVCTICYINYFLIVSPPSSGLGRALTKHTVNAIKDCFQVLRPLPQENYHLITWALFVGTLGSAGQIEQPWFRDNLTHFMLLCGWYTWDHAHKNLVRYIYIPHMHSVDWQIFWSEIMRAFFPQNALLQ